MKHTDAVFGGTEFSTDATFGHFSNSEVLGTTAALDGSGEWLALLVRLRATGKREVLLIYDPAGKLMHQELLERRNNVAGKLWSAGSVGTKQEFGVDLGGEIVRFALKN
jgi:hypothetical protein